MNRFLLSYYCFVLLLFGLVITDAQDNCDVLQDKCPNAMNKICEKDTVQGCQGGDCYDCDSCTAYHLDCNACISNGCSWCPGDARCSSVGPLIGLNGIYASFSSCPMGEDWVTDCDGDSEMDNFFR